MAIWHERPSLEYINQQCETCLVGHLGIQLVEVGDDFLTGQMEVDQRTRQPAGVLHGGASVALAETVATWGASFTLDRLKYHCVGMEINANHVRPIEAGMVTGTARPLHLGRRTQVWEIEITNEQGQLICISRITIAVLERPSGY